MGIRSFALVTLLKRATRVNPSHCQSWEFAYRFSEQFAHSLIFGERPEQFAHGHSFPLSYVSESLKSLTKNERFAQKTDEQISNPAHCSLLKGSVSQVFRPPVFFIIGTHLGP